MQRQDRISILVRLSSKDLGRCFQGSFSTAWSIGRKDRRSGKPEQVIFLKIPDDRRVHIAKLTPVTLVEDNDHPFGVNRMVLFLLDESGQLLNRSDDNMGVIILQLLF